MSKFSLERQNEMLNYEIELLQKSILHQNTRYGRLLCLLACLVCDKLKECDEMSIEEALDKVFGDDYDDLVDLLFGEDKK